MTVPLAQRLSDRLPAVVVKELRQGIKTRAFAAAFVVLQAVLALSVLAGSEQRRGPSEAATALFWFAVVFTFLVIQPLRGLGAVPAEVRADTLELVLLTRLSAFRIIAGKWASLVFQTALMFSGVLPYLLLRYYLGAVDVFADIAICLILLLGSMVLTAAGVGLSAIPQAFVRIGFAVLIVLGGMAGLTILEEAHSFDLSLGGGISPWAVWPLVLVAAALAGYFGLAWGAGRIAPAAENTALPRRIAGFALLLIAPLLAWITGKPDLVYYNILLILPICTDALTELPSALDAVQRPFRRAWVPGRVVRIFLLPGWPSGVAYTLLCCALLFAVTLPGVNTRNVEPLEIVVTIPGALLAPLALVLLVRPNSARLGAWYVLLQIVFLVLGFVAMLATSGSEHSVLAAAIHFIPTSAFFLFLSDEGLSWGVAAALFTTAAALAVIGVRLAIRAAARRAPPPEPAA